MKVKVTQEHIDKGKRRSSYKCPIALALIEGSTGYIGVYVMEDEIMLQGVVYQLPLKAQEFIKKYDDNFCVQPFEFEL